jgi:hypothetical protein
VSDPVVRKTFDTPHARAFMKPTEPTGMSALTRREFIATTAAAGTTLLAGPLLGRAESGAPPARRTRYALVGVGARSLMYRDAILRTYAAHCEMVGYCDANQGRLALAQRTAREGGVEVPAFLAADFERMVAETRPDVVIVATRTARTIATSSVPWSSGAT